MLWLLVLTLFCISYVYLKILMYPGDIPSMPGWLPILGHIRFLFGNRIDLVETGKKITHFAFENGGVVALYFGIIPMYFISDPEDCNKILSNCMHKPGLVKKLSKRFLGNGLLFGPVSTWKEHRKFLNPTFNQQVLDSFMDIFNNQGRRLINELKRRVDQGPFDQLFCLEKNTLETICLTTTGVDISEQCDSNDNCILAFRDVVSTIIRRVNKPYYLIEMLYERSDIKKEEDRHVRVIHELIDRVLRKHREEQNANMPKIFTEADTKFKPVLYRLLDQNNVSIEDKAIKDEMNNIIFAGFETTSSVLAFALVLLGTYPHIQEKSYQEICEVFGESDRDVCKDDLVNLKYIEAVLKETLRICPVAPITARIITEDIQLKNAVLRKGHMCVVSLYGALNHPSWGPDVGEFKPERWLEPGFPQNPNLMGAFGYGRRNCIGKVFAYMTMKVTLVHILRHYKLTGNYSNMKVQSKGITKPAYGHEISLEFRNK